MLLYCEPMYTYLVESTQGYFLWNEVSSDFVEIVHPTTLEDIYEALPNLSNGQVPDWSRLEIVVMEPYPRPTVESLPISWTASEHTLSTGDECFPSEELRLGPGKMILFCNPLSTYLLECDNKDLLWNELTSMIAQIVEPTKLEDICEALPDGSNMKAPDWSRLKRVDLETKLA